MARALVIPGKLPRVFPPRRGVASFRVSARVYRSRLPWRRGAGISVNRVSVDGHALSTPIDTCPKFPATPACSRFFVMVRYFHPTHRRSPPGPTPCLYTDPSGYDADFKLLRRSYQEAVPYAVSRRLIVSAIWPRATGKVTKFKLRRPMQADFSTDSNEVKGSPLAHSISVGPQFESARWHQNLVT